jgi:hypothetical protein
MAANDNRAAPAKRRPDQDVVLLDGEPTDYSNSPPFVARVVLRSIVSDEGHFQGLEAAS